MVDGTTNNIIAFCVLQNTYVTILLYFLDVGSDILRQPLELGLPGAGAVLVGVIVPLHPAASPSNHLYFTYDGGVALL